MAFPVTTTQGGTSMATPDTCLTPAAPSPIPSPYPNTAMMNQANPGTCPTKVKVVNKPPLTMKSEITMTSGDEAGSVGGVMSGMIKGPAKPKKGSSKVKVEGQPVIHQTAMFGHNGANANAPAGTHSSPSQSKVLTN